MRNEAGTRFENQSKSVFLNSHEINGILEVSNGFTMFHVVAWGAGIAFCFGLAILILLQQVVVLL